MQYGKYRYRDQVLIDFQEAESITAALTAIPALGFQFTEWRNAAGKLLSGTYTPQPGETITAVFESDSVAAGRKTLRVEASSIAAVGIKNFQCLKDGVWQQMNPEWNGDWKNGTSTVAGAYAQATCDGEVATVTLQTGPGRGLAQVSLNGQPVRTFDCSAEQAGSLTYDSREQTVRLTIPDNPGGDTVLRSFKYQNDAGQWQEVVVVNNAGKIDPRVYLSVTGWRNYNNYFMISNTPGAYAEFSFIGQAAAVTLQRGATRGMVEVTLDGRSKGRINTDYGRGGYAEHDFTLYVEGEKTVRIENAGRRNASSSDYNIVLSGFSYLDHNGVEQRLAYTDPAIVQTGKDWRKNSDKEWIYTNTLGDYAEFTGDVTKIHTGTQDKFGIVNIYVDGEFNQEVDLYSAAAGSKVIILKPGPSPIMKEPVILAPVAPLPGPKPENTPLPPRKGIPKVPGRKSSSM